MAEAALASPSRRAIRDGGTSVLHQFTGDVFTWTAGDVYNALRAKLSDHYRGADHLLTPPPSVPYRVLDIASVEEFARCRMPGGRYIDAASLWRSDRRSFALCVDPTRDRLLSLSGHNESQEHPCQVLAFYRVTFNAVAHSSPHSNLVDCLNNKDTSLRLNQTAEFALCRFYQPHPQRSTWWWGGLSDLSHTSFYSRKLRSIGGGTSGVGNSSSGGGGGGGSRGNVAAAAAAAASAAADADRIAHDLSFFVPIARISGLFSCGTFTKEQCNNMHVNFPAMAVLRYE